VNQQIKIARLKSLLDRVQARAKQPRAATRRGTATDIAEAATAIRGTTVEQQPVVVPPVVMALTPDSSEIDETRPFAKLPPEVLAPSVEKRLTPLPPTVVEVPTRHATDRPPPLEPSEQAEEIQPEAEPPASSRRPAQAREEEAAELVLEPEIAEEKHDTEPPASGPQLLEMPAVSITTSSEFEVDFGASPIEPSSLQAPAQPSVAQLGQMVDLEELPDSAQGGIELMPPPAFEPAAPSPPSEMEASLPGAQSPGAYAVELAPTVRASDAAGGSPFGAEAGTGDWELPTESSGVVESAAPAVPAAEVHALETGVEVAAKAEPSPKPAEQTEPEPVVQEGVVPGASAAEAITAEPAPKLEAPQAVQAEPTIETPRAEPTTPVAQPSPAGTLELVTQQPVHLEVVPVVVAPRQVASADVAVFVGAVRDFKPSTFVEWLDAALALGGK